jgi:hypothetical protein
MRYALVACAALVACEKKPTALTADEHDRAAAALDRAEADVKSRVDPFAKAWLDAPADPPVIGPACPFPLDQWIFVDARHEKLGLTVAKMTEATMERAPDQHPIPELVPMRPAPDPAWAVATRREIDALRATLEQPVVDHAKLIADATRLEHQAEMPSPFWSFAIVDVWYPPLDKPIHSGTTFKFEPGFVQTRSLVWDVTAKRFTCAGMATTSSPLYKGQKLDPDTLRRDLEGQIGKDLAASAHALSGP